MNPHDLPVVGPVLSFGPDDPVYDGLILAGPLMVLALAVLGRTVATVTLAIAYVAAFVAYVAYRAVRAAE